jgi:hypothetical protein
LAFDPVTGRLVLFGGFAPLQGQVYGDTWAWDGSNWTELHPATSPSPRYLASMAADGALGHVVLFGGEGGGGRTWAWDGSSWGTLTTTGPSARMGAAIAYDTGARALALFGGTGNLRAEFLGDTWTLAQTVGSARRP